MSLINTRIQNLRSNTNIDKNEFRASRYGAWDVFAQQTGDPAGIITPDMIEIARQSIGSTYQVPVIDFDAGVSIGSTRSVTIGDSENTSQMVTITFVTLAWGFTVVPALYWNNEIKIQRDFETKFTKYLNELAAHLDTLACAALDSEKNTVFADTLGYTVAGDNIQAKWKQREFILGDLVPIFAANDFYNQLHIIGNGGIESVVRNLTEKDLYNEINKQLQYADKVFHFTNRISNGAGTYGTAFAVPSGSLGVLTRVEREALLRTPSRTGHEWDVERLPLVDIEVGTYFYESVGDFNTIAGAASADLTRAKKEHYGFAFDVAFVTPYNSRPGVDADAISKFEVLEDDGS